MRALSAPDGASAPAPALLLTPQVVSQLRCLRSHARGLREELHGLRRLTSQQSASAKQVLQETCDSITASLAFLRSGDATERKLRVERMRLSRDEDSYRQDVRRLEKDLTNLETQVEELRSHVINRRCKVNMSDVESMAHILSRASKVVADLKQRYPRLQDSLRTVMQQEMEVVVREEK